MKRFRLIGLAFLLGSFASLGTVFNEDDEYITMTKTVVDEEAVARLEAEYEQRKGDYIKTLQRRISYGNQLIDLAGKKCETEDLWAYLDSFVALARPLDDPKEAGKFEKDYRKISEDAAKGKINKKMIPYVYQAILDTEKAISTARGQAFVLAEKPMKEVEYTAKNPYYRPSLVNNPRLLDSLDLAQQADGWEWLETENGVTQVQFYPTTIEFTEFASHPDYRLMAKNYLFDGQGRLVRYRRLVRGDLSVAFAATALKDLVKEDFIDNKYGIQDADAETRAALRYHLDMDTTKTTMTAAGDEWLSHTLTDYLDDFHSLYKIERLSPVAFRLYYLNRDGKKTYNIDLTFTGENFEPGQTFTSIVRADR